MPDLPPLRAPVSADTSGFVSQMGLAVGSLGSLSTAAGVATGALAVFAGVRGLGAAIASAVEFQSEMTRLNTLVGIQADQVRDWEDALLDLAPAVGRTPQELSRALFAITSGGERGSEALDLLEQAAKASAIGLGDTTDIARTATAALQAFGSQGLTAEKAVDVMVATVREGNLEASELAGALGQVTGTAATMGVTFEEVGANVAAFTRLGVNARVATTGLRAILNAILSPSDGAREAFDRLGISIDDMRRKLREDGLNAALVDLLDAADGNLDTIGQLIPNVRALAAALGTAGVQAADLPQIVDSINDSLGTVDEGFETTRGTAAQTFMEFEAAMESFKIEMGRTFLPPVTSGTEKLTGFVEALRETGFGLRSVASAQLQSANASARLVGAVTSTEIGFDATTRATESTRAKLEETQAWIDSGREAWENLFGVVGDGNDDLPPSGLGETSDQLAFMTQRAEQLTRRLTAVGQAFISPTVSIEDIDEAANQAAREGVVELQQQFFGLTDSINDVELVTKDLVGTAAGKIPQAARSYSEFSRVATISMRQIEVTSDRLAGELTDDLFDIIEQTESVSDAFGAMVDSILRETARLLIQQTITAPLAGAITRAVSGFVAGSASGGGATLAQPAGPRPINTGPVSRSTSGVTINVNPSFQIQALDAEGVDRVIRESGGPAVVETILRAAEDSEGISRALLTGRGA